MSKKQAIAITMDVELIERIDAVAEAREDSRSAVIERMARNSIGGEEDLVGYLANPVMREIVTRLMGSPKIMNAVAALVGEEVSEDQLKRMAEAAPKLKARGAQLAEERKRGRKVGSQGR